jgi:trehalose-6-phosphate synthase
VIAGGAVVDLNIIDQIGVIAVNDDKKCVEITVDVNGCKAEVKGAPIVSQFEEKGISVRKIQN